MNTESTHTTSHLNDDLLNAWLDGATSDAESEAIAEHLVECERCKDALESLREIKSLLGGLPEVRLPRSFALSPEMATKSPEPETPSNVVRLLPVTRILGIAAVIAFLVLGAANALGPVTQSLENDAGDGDAPTVMSAIGTNRESDASQEQAPPPMRAAAPGEVIDRGTSASSSNSVLESASSAMPNTKEESGSSALQVAWITSGVIAVVLVAIWAGIWQLSSTGNRHP